MQSKEAEPIYDKRQAPRNDYAAKIQNLNNTADTTAEFDAADINANKAMATQEAIIDEDTFNRVQELRNSRRRNTATGRGKVFSQVLCIVLIVAQSFTFVLQKALMKIRDFSDARLTRTTPEVAQFTLYGMWCLNG